MSRHLTERLPRPLHPGAWWLWALGLATAASRTTNPLLLALILVVVAQVVAARRSDAPWARGFKAYLILGLVVIAVRVVFRMLLGAHESGTVLFTLPEIPLPDIAAGVRLGGPVTAEGLLAAFYDGLRLATLLICIGAANVLANPKRLLKAVPPALYEVGVAVTVALTVAPQLIESGQRVRRAQRLRGESAKRLERVRRVVVPVLTDALERSLALAAAMDSRGYGRTADVARSTRLATGMLVLGGLIGVCIGTYGMLDATTSRLLGGPMLAGGLVLAAGGMALAGKRVQRTRYRPDPWRSPEWIVAGSGAVVAAVLIAIGSSDTAGLHPSVQPLTWPTLPIAATIAILIGLTPALAAPPVPRTSRPPRHRHPSPPPAAADHEVDERTTREVDVAPLAGASPVGRP